MRLRWFLTIAAAALVAAAVAFGFTIYDQYWTQLPPIARLVEYDPPVATRVYADDDSLIGEFYFEKRYLTPIEQIPDVVRDAFVAAEDASFHTHPGIDFLGIGRAAIANARAGDVVQGGSTITQQVVKALLLTPERSYRRKLREVMLSLKIERELSKDEILYLYLNQIYLGDGNYGIGAAAESYFGKKVPELDLAEAALLAGLPKAPSRYSPTRNPEGALARQRYVLRRMLEDNSITLGQYESGLRRGLPVASHSRERAEVGSYYIEAVRRLLIERFGTDAPYHKGYRVYTAMSRDLQRKAEDTMRAGIEKLDVELGYLGPRTNLPRAELLARVEADRENPDLRELVAGNVYEAVVTAGKPGHATVTLGGRAAEIDVSKLRWHPDVVPEKRALKAGDVVEVTAIAGENGAVSIALTQTPKVSAALVVMNPNSGGVKALVGGHDFAQSQFNRATQAWRQPGSAFKPFVYAAALDMGYTPSSILLDTPLEIVDHDRVWKPQNYSREYYGPTSLRRALEQSRNVVTVRLVQALGVNRVVRWINDRFSFTRPIGRHLSVGLGTTEVTPLELATAYTAFAAGGRTAEPVFITRIEDADGKLMEEDQSFHNEALSPQTAYLVSSMLEGVVTRGTGRSARVLGRPIAGKTGTTNDQIDAWFVGYTPDLLAAVWIGYDDRHTLGPQNTGGKIATPLWTSFMREALKDAPVKDFEVPEGIRCVNIDANSGLRARAGDGHTQLECYKSGTEPEELTPMWLPEQQIPAQAAVSDGGAVEAAGGVAPAGVVPGGAGENAPGVMPGGTVAGAAPGVIVPNAGGVAPARLPPMVPGAGGLNAPPPSAPPASHPSGQADSVRAPIPPSVPAGSRPPAALPRSAPSSSGSITPLVPSATRERVERDPRFQTVQ